MEASVASSVDPTIRRTVKLSSNPREAPKCCAYSSLNNGFPCLHGTAVLKEKHGANRLHNFIANRHTSDAWKQQYENVLFDIPPQEDIDNVYISAKVMVAKEENLRIPKALPPPNGRPGENAGKRKKGFLERGPASEKRCIMKCGLCHQEGHHRGNCPLAQVFDGNQS